MINPINHGKSAADIAIYKAEPYVMAADVYGVHPHTGRGGWTWYTGSAGWMYQLIIETFLGLNRVGDKLWFNPCIPVSWPSFRLRYRFKETWYHIEVIQSDEDSMVILDSVEQSQKMIHLSDDKETHTVLIKWKNTNHKEIPLLPKDATIEK
jgi:cellobiose phosphorylase